MCRRVLNGVIAIQNPAARESRLASGVAQKSTMDFWATKKMCRRVLNGVIAIQNPAARESRLASGVAENPRWIFGQST